MNLKERKNTKKIEALFLTPEKWTETAIHNIAKMGPFSADHSIQTYAKEIWGITPCPTDPAILAKVQDEYAEYDRRQFVR